MHNIKPQYYGIEPGITGFEEAVNLSYLSGQREGYDNGVEENKKQTAIKLIQVGVDDETIIQGTGLDLETIQKLKKQIND